MKNLMSLLGRRKNEWMKENVKNVSAKQENVRLNSMNFFFKDNEFVNNF